jgi:hypothetical protein
MHRNLHVGERYVFAARDVSLSVELIISHGLGVQGTPSQLAPPSPVHTVTKHPATPPPHHIYHTHTQQHPLIPHSRTHTNPTKPSASFLPLSHSSPNHTHHPTMTHLKHHHHSLPTPTQPTNMSTPTQDSKPTPIHETELPAAPPAYSSLPDAVAADMASLSIGPLGEIIPLPMIHPTEQKRKRDLFKTFKGSVVTQTGRSYSFPIHPNTHMVLTHIQVIIRKMTRDQ